MIEKHALPEIDFRSFDFQNREFLTQKIMGKYKKPHKSRKPPSYKWLRQNKQELIELAVAFVELLTAIILLIGACQ